MTSLQVCLPCAPSAICDPGIPSEEEEEEGFYKILPACLLWGLAVALQHQDSHGCYDACVSSGCKVFSYHVSALFPWKVYMLAPELFRLANSPWLEAVLIGRLLLIAELSILTCFVLHHAEF